MIAIRQMVTVDIDVIELVVEPYRLSLLIGLKQRPRVPEANVLDRVLIPRDHFGRQIGQGWVGGFLNRVQP